MSLSGDSIAYASEEGCLHEACYLKILRSEVSNDGLVVSSVPPMQLEETCPGVQHALVRLLVLEIQMLFLGGFLLDLH